MIENLQDELYHLENKQAKGAKLRANIKWELEGEKCSRNFFQSTWKTESAKSKQYLNYILMIINQNILVILKTFSNLQKIHEHVYTKDITSKAAATDFFSIVPNRKEIPN